VIKEMGVLSGQRIERKEVGRSDHLIDRGALLQA
jgi:hypothetical protein